MLCRVLTFPAAGVYKFPYPLTTTLFEFIATYLWLQLLSTLTRLFARPLTHLGLAACIAPSYPHLAPPTGGYRGHTKRSRIFGGLQRLSGGAGGIAGGGWFEFDLSTAKLVLPVAVLFVAKVVLSNLSFAYALLPMYLLARVAIVPLSVIFTTAILRTPLSVSTMSSALAAALFFGISVYRVHTRVTWESIIAGVFSSLFVALYPVQLQRTYKALVAGLVPQGDLLSGFTQNYGGDRNPQDCSGTKEESRATYRLLHYTSLLSILLLVPIVVLSGELGNISRNCYFLDVFFFWLMMVCCGLGSWAVFIGTIMLMKATSPLTTTLVFIPQSAFMLASLEKFRLPAHSWVGMSLCWAACGWFMFDQRKEGRTLERLRRGA